MKTTRLMLALVLFAITANAQVTVNINPTVVTAPAPTVVRYYYLPDYGSYYDISTKRYIYLTNGRWVYAKNMPGKYKNYAFDRCRKVEITDYRGNAPYVYYKRHRVLYRPTAVVARRPATVYVVDRPGKGHWKGHGKGHGRGHGHGHH